MEDCRPLFRPLHEELLRLLEGLSDEEWLRPTVAGSWRVRDVVAHLIDTDLRRVSGQRDGHVGPPPEGPVADWRDLVGFLNDLNRTWIEASARLSPAVLLDLVRHSGEACAQVMEQTDPLGTALFPVAWAGESRSPAWMDVGREFTEKWHHQQQIRDAVGAPLLLGERWTGPLFRLSVLSLPRAYEDVPAPEGTAVELVIEGEGGGAWWVVRGRTAWELASEAEGVARATVRLSTDEAWRLFYNALSEAAKERIRVEGDRALAGPLLDARSVMV